MAHRVEKNTAVKAGSNSPQSPITSGVVAGTCTGALNGPFVGVGAGRCQALSQMILPCCFIGLTLKKSKSTHNSLSYQTVRLSNTKLY